MIKKICKKLLLILLVLFFAHTIYVIFDGLKTSTRKVDVALVFGNKIENDGLPSKRLQARLDEGVKLYKNKRIKKIIVSGGFGKEGFWEGTAMQKYLLKNEVNNADIVVDNKGINTEKSVINSLKILDSLNYKSIISVSQFYHQTRIKLIFRKKSFKNYEISSPKYFELRDFYSLFREFFAFYDYLIFKPKLSNQVI